MIKSSRTVWAVAAVAAGAGLVALCLPQTRMSRHRQSQDDSDRVDEALEDSFPASDPPSFSAPAAANPASPATID